MAWLGYIFQANNLFPAHGWGLVNALPVRTNWQRAKRLPDPIHEQAKGRSPEKKKSF